MKKLTFTVTLTFADKLTDDDAIDIVAENIGRAIKQEANSYGIAPVDSDTYLEFIEVKPQFSDLVYTSSMKD